MYKTYQPKHKDIKREWHLIDAKGKVLGRLAGEVAKILIGKHKELYSQHMDMGDIVVDDLLDVTSDFAGLKKQKGNDIYESKRTLILGHLLRNIKGKDKEKLIEIISKKRSDKNQKEVDWVISKMHEYKSIKYAKNKAILFKKRADEILKSKLTFLNKEPYANELKTLMNFILERDH